MGGGVEGGGGGLAVVVADAARPGWVGPQPGTECREGRKVRPTDRGDPREKGLRLYRAPFFMAL